MIDKYQVLICIVNSVILFLNSMMYRPLRITHTPHNGDADENEDPKITKERERLIKVWMVL